MAHNLKLSAIVLSVADVVAGKVVLGLAVTQKQGRSESDWLSLHLKAVVRIRPIDDPLSNVSLLCVHACFLLATNWRIRLWSLRRAAQV